MAKKIKRRYFDKQVRFLATDIANMLPACRHPLDHFYWERIRFEIQRLVNKAYRHGYGRGDRDGMDNPRA